jgi:release factor glutamine methyltransferase
MGHLGRYALRAYPRDTEPHADPDPERANGRPPRGIYPPREDSWLLVPFARAGPSVRVLEIGAGAGEAAMAAARSGARVVATDRNPAALAWLRDRAAAAGLSIDLVRTDLATGLGRFDRIVANPPYLPTPVGGLDPEPGDRLALDGGPDGTAVTARIVDALDDHLAARGTAFLLVSSVQSPAGLDAIRRRWNEGGGRCRVVASRELEGERLEVWELDRVRPGG